MLIVRCRRPGLPAARGDSPARAGSAAIPRVRAQAGAHWGTQGRSFGKQLSPPAGGNAQWSVAAATLRGGASRTLGRDPVRPQLAYKSTSNLVNIFPRPPPAQRCIKRCLVVLEALSEAQARYTNDAARHTTCGKSPARLAAWRPRRGATSRAAEACPGYCKPAGASQRTYSASTEDPWI